MRTRLTPVRRSPTSVLSRVPTIYEIGFKVREAARFVRLDERLPLLHLTRLLL
jgi:hypothetical protein